eukprot:CAMPEP_0117431284 /NCGR_PEP_ID=MMETSP0758-20121206/10822_1 /TAXON_ID=63605 /ORGANISM="Percolomonas cosmopolitus, Strain AE-1 (ATCC 50343)" /LENGTH=300 /DNA_ID=CAMNT_0005220147 /DNA_START=12 /DNA_END=910 /DNA_ORIENTATION=-
MNNNIRKATNQIVKTIKRTSGGGGGSRSGSRGGGNALLLPLSLVGGFLIFKSVYKVDAGYRAVKFNRWSGIQDRVYDEGYQFQIPFFEWFVPYEIRVQYKDFKSITGSKDLQKVDLAIRILYAPDAMRLPKLYRELGTNYDQVLFESLAHETMKSVIAQYNSEQLLTNREGVTQQIYRELKEATARFDVNVRDVSILNLRFGKEYEAAIERKQVAKQDAEAARYMVLTANQQRDAIIVRAEGEAESIEKVGRSMKGHGYLDIKRIDTAREVAEILSQANNQIYLNANSLLVDLSKVGDES